MSLSRLAGQPIGSVAAEVGPNPDAPAGCDDMRYVATLREKVWRAVRVTKYYGETAEEALAKLIASKRRLPDEISKLGKE